MYIAVLVVLRSAGGFGLSAMFALTGFLVVWVAFRFSDFAWPQWVFVAVWFSAAGIGGGLGSFLAWMSLEVRSTRETAVSAVILVFGGLAGAWGGYYVEAILPEDPDPFGGRAISSAALLWATLVPNLGATAFGVLKGIRTGWM